LQNGAEANERRRRDDGDSARNRLAESESIEGSAMGDFTIAR
jgi:hypothetical protein